MPFSRPTRDRLVSRCVADVEAELQNGASLIRHTLERALATATAGLAHTQHGHLEFAARQVIWDTADDEFLVRWAEMFLAPNGRKQPTKASFPVLLTGTLAEAPIDAGTRMTRADGVVFETTAAAALPALEPFEVQVAVQAVDAGSDGNTVPGAVLTLESAVADIEPEATVVGDEAQPIGGGSDLERIEDLRARFMAHLQTPPKGGGPGDYEAWALEVEGVTRAWELPLQLGPDTVLVLFVQDVFDADGFWESTTFPSEPDALEVEDYIAARCPVTIGAENLLGERGITVQAPVQLELNPTIALSPNTAEVQAEVTLQLQDLLLRSAEPGGTLRLSQIREAISLAPGEDFHTLVSPVADVVAEATELLVLGTPVYQDA